MISHELSMIQMNDPLRAELAADIDAFLSVGGTIQELPGFGIVHRPITYSTQMPPSPKPFVRRRVERAPPKLSAREQAAVCREQVRIEMVARVSELSKTMTRNEVMALTDLSRHKLYRITEENNLTFKLDPAGSFHPNKIDVARDAKNAERIKAFMEIGISRRQCRERLEIGVKGFDRILRTYEIDYPKRQAGGGRKCAE